MAAAQGEVRPGQCATCHGADGNSQMPGIPSIAGQPRVFLETQLILFREGVRAAPQKDAVIRGLSDRDIASIAAFFAARPLHTEPGRGDPALIRQGQSAAQKLGCGTCHLPDYQGREQIPRLAGQREDYLVQSMIAFRDNPRPGGDTIMAANLYGVPDAEVRAMAHFFSRYRPRE